MFTILQLHYLYMKIGFWQLAPCYFKSWRTHVDNLRSGLVVNFRIFKHVLTQGKEGGVISTPAVFSNCLFKPWSFFGKVWWDENLQPIFNDFVPPGVP